MSFRVGVISGMNEAVGMGEGEEVSVKDGVAAGFIVGETVELKDGCAVGKWDGVALGFTVGKCDVFDSG